MSQKTYRIGEAAAKLNLKSYVLRFWETEFSQITPIRTEKGQRLYTESDLAVLGRIRYLLHERGLTIDGARRLLREEAAKGLLPTDAGFPDDIPEDMLEEMDRKAEEDSPHNGGQTNAARRAPDEPEALTELPQEKGPVPEQATLFSRPADPTPEPCNTAALRAVITELEGIRRLLGPDTPGDMR